jgi:catechol 2,3-dioxygenase-like lactoylglutathione lyase family enzyme
MKLEVVVFNVSDVDRAKAFYENLGWRLDIDIAEGGYRNVHVTPPNSDASIIFGKGVTPTILAQCKTSFLLWTTSTPPAKT